MKKIAVVLSGCGFQDGTEITEAVSTLIAIGQNKASYQCFAPTTSYSAVDHLTGHTLETRNTLNESARICRGQVSDLSELNPSDYDALVIPGGFGAALHLSNWAQQGAQSTLDTDITRIIKGFYEQTKPIGAICIAPTLVAKVLGDQQVTVTIGNDKATAQEIEKTGAIHEDCPVDDFVTDRAHRVVTCPAYMYDQASPYEVSLGISGLIKELVEMA